jgi:hypothetical protein
MKRYDWEIGDGPNYVLGSMGLGDDREPLIAVAAQAAERACRQGLRKARYKSTEFNEATGLNREYRLWVQMLCDDARTWKVAAETADRKAYLILGVVFEPERDPDIDYPEVWDAEEID